MENEILNIENLKVVIGGKRIINEISMSIPRNRLTSIIGPAGSGKTVLLNTLNRTVELEANCKINGKVELDNINIYSFNPIEIRRKFGKIFPRPNPFPSMSIYNNVLAGYLLNNVALTELQKDKIVEKNLKLVDLWELCKYNLHNKYNFLNTEQRQKLCFARALAIKPDILLLDNPTHNMSPSMTNQIALLIEKLKKMVTIVLATDNISLASRISDFIVVLIHGELIEYGTVNKILTAPDKDATEQYISNNLNI